MYFGIAAVSFAAVLQILTLPSLDTALWISLYCFSISIPMNVFMGYIWTYLSEIFSYRTAFVSEIIGTAGGNGIASIGIAAIFWHFSSTIGIIFLISGAFGWCHSAQSVGRADIERQDGSLAKFNRRRRGAARNQVKIPVFRGSGISREEILAHALRQLGRKPRNGRVQR
jgi:hypothetical protein